MPQCAPWVDNPVGRYQIVTSGTRPTGSLRPTGAVIYETDTGLWNFWNGTAWAPLAPRTIGYVALTSAHAGITTVTDLSFGGTPLAVTFTALAGRRYRVTASAHCITTVSGDVAGIVLADGANNQLQTAQAVVYPVGNDVRITTIGIFTPGAGVVTYKARGLRAAGTGSLTYTMGAASPGFILVEDIGV